MRLIDADDLEKSFLGECRRHKCDKWDISAIVAQINDAPTIVAPPNDLLSPEELREMDGEPVWVILPADAGWEPCWMIVMTEFNIVARDLNIYRAVYCRFDGCGTYWLAYRRKPEEGT